MQRVVVRRPGGFERLELEEAPDPTPGPGEVVVAAEAVGVNFADVAVRTGLYAAVRRYGGYPVVPGFEAAGTVAAVGAGIDDLAVGDPVVAVTRFGGYASRVRVPRAQVLPRPPGFSAQEAAATPTVFLTAWYALVRLADVRPGARVLVHSAAGGVGGMLLQLARAAGARAIGVVGAAHKVGHARACGAEVVVDASREDPWPAVERAAPGGLDVVLDANGVATLRESYRHLAPEGRLVVYGFHTMLPRGRGRPPRWRLALAWLRTPRFDPIRMTSENRSVLAFNLAFLFDRTALLGEAWARLLELAERGEVRPPPVEAFPLADAAAAHRRLQSGTTTGKLVLLA